MNYGFIKAAASTPEIKVADCEYNAKKICEIIDELNENCTQLAVFPELCITGYTCGDLFNQSLLLSKAKEQVINIAKYAKEMDMLITVGFPFQHACKIFNVAAVIFKGEILGLVPKTVLPNYGEFYEMRHFLKGHKKAFMVDFCGKKVPFGTDILFKCKNVPEFVFAVEICEDVWAPKPPSIEHALAGATVIGNLSASSETVGKDGYRKKLIEGQSARLMCGYIYSDAGNGESTTDLIFSSHNLIYEDGTLLAESKRFINQTVYADIDLERIAAERRKTTSFISENNEEYFVSEFEIEKTTFENYKFSRKYDMWAFVPSDIEIRTKTCEEILEIQSLGLVKRLEHSNSKSAVVGISGGLDSTLALIVTARAFDKLNISRKNIIAVTMPGFGTTDRTYDNAVKMIESIGCTFKEISIEASVRQHFKDIGHDEKIHDVTYENSQARQRTMILMDMANQNNGLVIGTGDLSELVLGWATYNGDHMSMYAVNASVPKTLIRYIVKYYADTCEDKNLSDILNDVLDTPVSPELLPPDDGEISQKTEDIVGPYELHDFFIYYVLRFGFDPMKILFIANHAFSGVYEEKTIHKWLKNFYRRFFSQQFKRSCLPDGPKVGTIDVSPRGSLRMPSDAVSREWLDKL